MPALFLGYVLHPGWRALPPANVQRFRHRLNSLHDRWQAGTVGMPDVQQRVDAWLAHAAHANTWRLQQDLFQDKRFDPARRQNRTQTLQAWKTTGRTVQHKADVAV